MPKESKTYLLLIVLATTLFVMEFNSGLTEDNMYLNHRTEDIGSILVHTTANIYLIPSNNNRLQIEGDKDLVNNLEVIQMGNNLVVQIKNIYNPFKLIKLAYESSKPINIYISGPNAKNITLQNRENFIDSNVYESDQSKMIALKKPRLFSKINMRGATCSTIKTSILM